MSLITYLFILFLLLLILSGVFVVKQQTAGIIERFGKFTSIRQSGLHYRIPLIDKIAGRLSLRILQLDVIVETKTKDDVFVKLKVSVQYKVVKEKVYDAFYKLDYPQDQITSYVFDVVRAVVPKMKLDDVFEKKDEIANAVKGELNDAMINYGYDIIKALVTDIDPDTEVKAAMNRINAAERKKVAAQYEGDAERILIVEKAKAEAESKRLQGQGIADQRREIARGLEDTVELPRWVWLGLNLGALFGFGFAIWLITQSLYVIGALCPWCMVVWAATMTAVSTAVSTASWTAVPTAVATARLPSQWPSLLR